MVRRKLGRKGLAAVATIASPETILRWYRELVAKQYDGSDRRGYKLGRNTIKRILQEHGIDPAPERRRHMPGGLARADGVGQSSRRDLFGFQVGRDVDVAGRQEFGKLGRTDEAVVEDRMRIDAERFRPILEHQPIHLPLTFPDVGVGRTEHDVHGLGKAFEDRRQRIDDVLDTLVGG